MADTADLKPVRKLALQRAPLYCLGAWLAVWAMFLLMRFSPLDIRVIPAIGPILLLALAVSFLAPLVGLVLSAVALYQQPGRSLNWLAVGCSGTALFGQALIFTGGGYL